MPVVLRTTRETRIRLKLTRAAGGSTRISSGEPFLDHMMTTLARYAAWDLSLDAAGDLRHHLIEDVAIATGEAVRALAEPGVARFADRTVPMDDALVQAAIDLGGRSYYRGPLPSRLYDHWMRSFATEARAALHIRVLRRRDRHHVIEAAFKALGLALAGALEPTAATASVKGTVELRVDPC